MAIRVPFKMRNTDTQAFDAGLNLSSGGVIQVSKWGAAFANGLGAYTDLGNGTYYYTLDATEEVAPWVLVRVTLTGYDIVEQREDVGTTTDAAITALEAYIDAAVVTIDGHTDTATAGVTTAVNAHTDTQISAAETAINGHTDTATAAVITAVDGHTDSQLSAAVTAIDAHTDGATSPLATSSALAAVASSLSTDSAAIEAAVAAIPTNPVLVDDMRLDHLDADVTSRLAPTVPGRTLNVSAGGEADANVAAIVDDAISAGALSAAAATKIIDALYAYVEESATAFPNAETFGQRRRVEFAILALKAPADLFSSPYEFRDGADSKDRAAYDMVDGVRTPTTLDGT